MRGGATESDRRSRDTKGAPCGARMRNRKLGFPAGFFPGVLTRTDVTRRGFHRVRACATGSWRTRPFFGCFFHFYFFFFFFIFFHFFFILSFLFIYLLFSFFFIFFLKYGIKKCFYNVTQVTLDFKRCGLKKYGKKVAVLS